MENDLNRTEALRPEWNSPILGLLLCCLIFVTVFGNVLVIVAVFKERSLKSVANYYIISLAFADLCVGLFVMPISALNKVTNNYWFFGDVLCDVWHSIDICASTASINSLLIIALDRYSAISDPISYHNGRLTRHWLFFVLLIWIGSAFISFPAIAYWRWLTPIYPPNQCDFPNDLYYLVFSSLVSFYIPLPVMVFVYVRMYRAATTQMIALKTGQKLNCKTADGKPLILRIHRGGTKNTTTKVVNQKPSSINATGSKSTKSLELSRSLECLLINNLSSMGPFTSSFSSLIHTCIPRTPARSYSLQNIEKNSAGLEDMPKFDRIYKKMDSFEQKNYTKTKKYLDIYFDGSRKKLLKFYNEHYYGHCKLMNANIRLNSQKTNELLNKHNLHHQTNIRNILSSFRTKCKRTDSNLSNGSNFYFNYNENELKSGNSLATKVKGLSLAKKLKKFTKEQKAAKTLGIVMGVFIICWLPFFIYNVITGIFQANLSDSHDTIFFVFTWFGYLNSGCNPIIYAFSSRDFRRAFYKILFPASFLKDKKRKNFLFSMQSSGLSTRDSRHHLVSSRLNNSVNKLKSTDIYKPSCSLCKDFELVLAKNSNFKSPWYSFKSSQMEAVDSTKLKNRLVKSSSSDLKTSFRTKIGNLFSLKSSLPTNRSDKIYEPKMFNGPNKTVSKYSSFASSNCKKKTGQIPIGTRYRFKTFKQPAPIGSDFYNQSDISQVKIGFTYECNEDDEYLNQIHSSVMRKKLETCNSSKF